MPLDSDRAEVLARAGSNYCSPRSATTSPTATGEIKARGRVIVGLMHEDVGHLGIFVSGKVANRQYAQIVSVLKSIEALPSGLYGLEIAEPKDPGGKLVYEVSCVGRRRRAPESLRTRR